MVETATWKRVLSLDLEFITDSKCQVWIVNAPLTIMIDPYFVKDAKPRTLEELLQIEALYSFQNINPSYMKSTAKDGNADGNEESDIIEIAKTLEPLGRRLIINNGQVRNKESPLHAIKMEIESEDEKSQDEQSLDSF